MSRKFNPKVADTARELIGKFLRQRREEIGWSQAKVAEIANIRQATVNDVEHGRNYEINTLLAMLGAMRCEIQIITKDIDSLPHFGKPEKN